MMKLISKMQPMGRALMLPIAVLPVAALLLRLGQPDLLNLPAIAAAGDAIFSNLGLLFAIGVAVGLAKENHGAAGLAAIVGYLVATQGAKVLIDVPDAITADVPEAYRGLAAQAFLAKELSKLSVPVGLLSGLFAGWAFNRFGDIRLPAYLAFFGGRRFVPIISGFAGLGLAMIFGFFWQPLEHGMDVTSQAVLASEEYGLFTYGVLNRVLIITGLHHILNNIAWFLLGDYGGVTGDLKRFFAGDPSAGAFMSGFFPVMMFGLPGACLAMYRTASPEKRAGVGGLLLSMALTSFLTGVTEPIEYAFMFLAPVLYAVHAVLTGLSMVIMHALNVHLGFGFSAGLFDYVLNYSLSTNPLLLIPVGLAYFALYFVLFRWVILRFDLKTLGREGDDVGASVDAGAAGESSLAWIAGLGGAMNLRAVEACTTRLRLTVVDQALIDERALKPLGSRGVLKLAEGAVQVVVGPIADQLAADIRGALRHAPATVPAATQASTPLVSATADRGNVAALLAALGGKSNLAKVEARSTRLLIEVRDGGAVDEPRLSAAGYRGAVRVADRGWQVVVGPDAASVAGILER
ncbi:MAG: system, N-acetylglucosamine-specific subunit [Steroidobacteraceae bacterium]|jgi:PTS system N-acetylglucosamine-specific IIC component|nr:system, N-acetylglucosamine-specific subunit [Steroidobacteraceae bacterium]